MDIENADVKTLWYENKEGKVWVPKLDWLEDGPPKPPEGFIYHHSRFPTQLTHTILKIMPDGTSKEIATGSSSWPEDLVLRMAYRSKYNLGECIIIVASSCEKCMNILAHEYELEWGYAEDSEEAKKSKTTCEFCT